MLDKMVGGLDFHAKALVLRAERQRVIASNIANADTPGYTARDFDFREALSAAQQAPIGAIGATNGLAGGPTHPGHLPIGGSAIGSLGQSPRLAYTAQSQPSMDGNSVDLDRERANFADNSVRYEASLRFINGYSRTILSAIQGQ